MKLPNQCIENLSQISELLEKLSPDQYRRPCSILSGASIGQHVRHILEFYQCLLFSEDNSTFSYDDRKRVSFLEYAPSEAIKLLEAIVHKLKQLKEDAPLKLIANFDITDDSCHHTLDTSLFRELAYNLEHSIHHQALIKIGMKELKLDIHLPDHFGMAPATFRNNNQLQETSTQNMH
ncbi:DinB family protein [Echinicola strongylocentroti]|uniref:DinB family protein n=1 Tax=Echinicola strongylocentroti TaxID=1795355 RepID=A0A2Z4IF25_9BACT|nr:DinB family protein [Echinicola strongylocentroti]AWW29692.1 DinB family protein [Echinicola strongylocentroti]